MATMIKRLVFIALLACPLPSPAADLRVSREVAARGEDLAGQLNTTVEEIKQELADRDCERFTVAYWSDSVPLQRLNVEVTCRRSAPDETLALSGPGR